LFGWALGIVLSVIGMGLSYHWDFPSGAFIVVCFTALPVILLLLSPIVRFRYEANQLHS
jgi:ABC-type Mn2+/Zn2+ transport system permease subunit